MGGFEAADASWPHARVVRVPVGRPRGQDGFGVDHGADASQGLQAVVSTWRRRRRARRLWQASLPHARGPRDRLARMSRATRQDVSQGRGGCRGSLRRVGPRGRGPRGEPLPRQGGVWPRPISHGLWLGPGWPRIRPVLTKPIRGRRRYAFLPRNGGFCQFCQCQTPRVFQTRGAQMPGEDCARWRRSVMLPRQPLGHAPSSAAAASTMASMPHRTTGGRSSQAAITRHRSGLAPAAAAASAPDSAPPPARFAVFLGKTRGWSTPLGGILRTWSHRVAHAR